MSAVETRLEATSQRSLVLYLAFSHNGTGPAASLQGSMHAHICVKSTIATAALPRDLH